ncbi:MAG: hypothetical protein GY822_24220 [Deltaproteobacteria bacterium]|nr:hypothetical protein [Deltaproteobacteria bacterium]
MGHGKLHLDVDKEGGTAQATTLHYGHFWSEKCGETVRTHTPVDHFAVGFSAAAAALAFGFDGETLDRDEVKRIAMRHDHCEMVLRPGGVPLLAAASANQTSVAPLLRDCPQGLHEDTVADITSGLNTFLVGVKPDSRGLIEAFGVYVTLHLSNYYNAISFGALAEVAKKGPAFVDVFADLLRELGHVCVFKTFGGMLLSPEWERLVGAPTEIPNKSSLGAWPSLVLWASAIGHWNVLTREKRWC